MYERSLKNNLCSNPASLPVCGVDEAVRRRKVTIGGLLGNFPWRGRLAASSTFPAETQEAAIMSRPRPFPNTSESRHAVFVAENRGATGPFLRDRAGRG